VSFAEISTGKAIYFLRVIRNYIYACTMKLYDILNTKNALEKPVYYNIQHCTPFAILLNIIVMRRTQEMVKCTSAYTAMGTTRPT
jgi:hypothetical protein